MIVGSLTLTEVEPASEASVVGGGGAVAKASSVNSSVSSLLRVDGSVAEGGAAFSAMYERR